ncbi:hypothetical protein GY45DRAFT_1264804 [Cubamyces sp. BRFM 1775]|nr:hypothetical protein GY45DRAFT_1264804 [Cubamyces sp. BRFM 1775]
MRSSRLPSVRTPQNSTVVYKGPYYVVLGGASPGVYEGTRPANTALGHFASLVPIVIACSLSEDAEVINTLNSEIFTITPPEDAYRLLQLVQWDDGPLTKITLKTPGPYYAIRYGVETGIYIGFQWYVVYLDSMAYYLIFCRQQIMRFVPSNKHVYKGFSDLGRALEFMLDKPGFNVPLLPANARLPPPDFPAPHDVPPSDAPEERDTSNITRQTPRSRSTSPVKPSSRCLPPSPAKPPYVEKKVKIVASAAPSTSSPVRTKAAKHTKMPTAAVRSMPPPAGLLRTRSAPEDVDRYYEQRAVGYDDGDDGVESDDTILRHVFKPAFNMPGGNTSLPITLGAEADTILVANGLNAEEVLTVLQIYVYSDSVEQFAYYMGLNLEWPTVESYGLWQAIELPLASNIAGR